MEFEFSLNKDFILNNLPDSIAQCPLTLKEMTKTEWVIYVIPYHHSPYLSYFRIKSESWDEQGNEFYKIIGQKVYDSKPYHSTSVQCTLIINNKNQSISASNVKEGLAYTFNLCKLL